MKSPAPDSIGIFRDGDLDHLRIRLTEYSKVFLDLSPCALSSSNDLQLIGCFIFMAFLFVNGYKTFAHFAESEPFRLSTSNIGASCPLFAPSFILCGPYAEEKR